MVHSAYDSFQLLGVLRRSELSNLTALSSSWAALMAPSAFTLQNHPIPIGLRRPINTLRGCGRKPTCSKETSRALRRSPSYQWRSWNPGNCFFHFPNLLRLPNFETIAVITNAKGANMFSWDDRRGFLCFARQTRVCIFRHDGGRGFVEVKEFGVPDVVKSMSWCSKNICLGIRREYVILNAANGALSEVFTSWRLAPPLVISLPSGELLLGKENIGVFVDQNGKLLPEGRICRLLQKLYSGNHME